VNTLHTAEQIHFENILFATDFSSTTTLALPYAVEIARKSGAMMHVAHVISPDVYPLVPPEEWPRMAVEEQEFRQSKQNELEGELAGLPHEFLLPAGDVWENLSRIIDQKHIDLMVLGTHGRTGIKKAVFGSVAERIFLQATCPVLTVGPRVSFRAAQPESARADIAQPDSAHLNCILYATDFSPESIAAARYAIYLAKAYNARLVLMHSIQKVDAGQVTSAFETLRDVVPLGAGLASRPNCVVERGTPADSILGVAMRENVDMIVLGIRSKGRRAEHSTRFAHSIAYKVVTLAECPVLTVRG
jgi:nucleotide-binding universal stress UspA family protein